jgi:hypothetical protein
MEKMKTVNFDVSRTVKLSDGSELDRIGRVTIEVPESIEEALAEFGESGVLDFIIRAATSWARVKVSNTLAQPDAASRALEKAVRALKSANPALDESIIRTMLLQNPQISSAVNRPVEKEVSFEFGVKDYFTPSEDEE